MAVPNYIVSALRGARYYFGPDCVAGYSVKIYKRTIYEYSQTLHSRCDRIITWCNKQVEGSAEIVACPKDTHYSEQFAVINIFDPVMLNLEKYIKNDKR